MIISKDADEALYKTCLELRDAPEHSPRGLKTKELINRSILIQNPEYSVITNSGRKMSYDYLKKELDWYLSGDKDVSEIEKHASIWSKVKNENNEVNSNYGEMIFYQDLENFDGNQYDWVVNQLRHDKDSRQALINFNQPKHKKQNEKDFPCTVNLQYLIRDNKLIGITNMRSNDFIYGFGNDFPFFSYIQQKVLSDLKGNYQDLELGPNYHNVASLHIYERHFDMMNHIIQEYEKNQPKSLKLEDIISL